MRLPDAVLFDSRQTGVERQHFQTRVVAAQRVGRVVDLALTGQEHEHIAVALQRQFVDRVDDPLHLIGRPVLFGLERSIPHFDRIRATADLDDRRIAEVFAEAGRVDGGGGDDQLQIGALG
ncbi:unannotated protein [freshwater metagenome]|uniref:Unannotated protein n=1 Tax=freshwater metagenome TaxID=449393 RepID=A0A6J6ZRD5_9ZZZZ